MKLSVIITFVVFLACGFLYGIYQGYSEYVHGNEYFELRIEQLVDQIKLEIVQYGRASNSRGWESASDRVADEVMNKCGNCVVLEKQKIKLMPKGCEGIFENKPVSETYISLDTKDHDTVDIRMFRHHWPQRYRGERKLYW